MTADEHSMAEARGNAPEEASTLEKLIRRRDLLLAAWAAVGAVAAAELVGITLRFLSPREGEGNLGGKVVAGRVEDFPPGTVTYIRQGRFFLVRLKSAFLALYQVCTHLGCAVLWNDQVGRFECPCHGAVFNTKGEVLAGPPPRPLDYFPVEVVNGTVVVDTSALSRRTQYDDSQATEG
ncbi:MAG: QcrA and Rieske domain-containing protein [Anaerolineae bacterium]